MEIRVAKPESIFKHFLISGSPVGGRVAQRRETGFACPDPMPRPGLVLMICDPDLVVARVATHPPRDDSDVALQRWSEAGLLRSSTVRLKKLATIDNRLIHHTIGHLERDDAHLIAQSWQRMAAALGAELQV